MYGEWIWHAGGMEPYCGEFIYWERGWHWHPGTYACGGTSERSYWECVDDLAERQTRG